MIMYILFWAIVLAFVSFVVGYPIYKKMIKKETFNWLWYALVTNCIALAVNVVNLIIKLFNISI